MLQKNKIFLPRKALCLALLTVIGWSLVVSLIYFLKKRSVYTVALLYALKLIFALSALFGPRTRSRGGRWVLFILTLPALAIPLYLLSGRCAPSKRAKKLIEKANAEKPKCEPFEGDMLLKCNENFTFLRDISKNPSVSLYTDTDAKYYSESSEMLTDLYCDLGGARRFILLEFYTVAAGEVFGKVVDILKKKASEGVEVKILYDAVGSLFKLPENFAIVMKEFGITARQGSSLFTPFCGGINNRNHRKIAIIDGEVAYTGGINLADEYIHSRSGMGKWKDCGVKIFGQGVDALTHTFLSDFIFSGGECENFSKYYKYKRRGCDFATVLFHDGPYPLYEEGLSENLICSLISSSEKSFVMTSPYLVFGPRIFSAIESAVRRGVKVKIIIPSTRDKLLTSILTKRYAKRLVRAGAEVYLYLPGFLHCKIYSADKRLIMVGTVNLDYRSLLHNFENGIIFTSPSVIEDIEGDLSSILSVSAPFEEKQNPIIDLIGALLELFAPLF